MEAHACTCGLIVVVADDLDDVGLCVICAGSGHDFECACLECAVYRDGVDTGVDLSEALENALTSARAA